MCYKIICKCFVMLNKFKITNLETKRKVIGSGTSIPGWGRRELQIISNLF